MPETKVKTAKKCSSCDGRGMVADPHHGQGQKCEPCLGSGVVVITLEKGRFTRSPGSEEDKLLLEAACGVDQCRRPAIPDRKICENHAFPAARSPETTGRRALVLATKKKLAAQTKVSEDMTDGSDEEEAGSAPLTKENHDSGM